MAATRVIALAGVARPTAYAKGIRNRGFLRYGLEFFAAAQKTGSPIVRAFLLGHALELLLKTFLLTQGMKESELKARRYWHHLDRLLEECLQRGLSKHIRVSFELQEEIGRFSAAYSSKALQYFALSFLLVPPAIPDLRRTQRFTKRLAEVLTSQLRPA